MEEHMSIFETAKKKKFKRRQTLCKEAEIFVQVHFVRDRNLGNNKYNTLSLKDDPDRIKCNEWYKSHSNPTSYRDIVTCYINDKKLDEHTIEDKCLLTKNYFEILRSNKNYIPSKGEVFIMCFALHLNYEESRALLKSVGYAYSNSEKSDLIIRYFIENHEYNLNHLNYCLDHFDLPKIQNL